MYGPARAPAPAQMRRGHPARLPRPRPFRGCGRGFFGVRRLVGPLPGSGLRPGLPPGAAPPPGCGLRPPSGPPLAAPRVGGRRPSAACLGLSAPAAARRGPASAPPAASLRRPGGRRLGRPRSGGPGCWPPPARASLPGGPRSAAAAPLGRPRLRPRRAPPAAAPSLVPLVAGAAVGLARAGLRLSRRPLLPSLRPPGRPWLPGPCVGASGAAPPPGRAWGPRGGPFFGSGPGRAPPVPAAAVPPAAPPVKGYASGRFRPPLTGGPSAVSSTQGRLPALRGTAHHKILCRHFDEAESLGA